MSEPIRLDEIEKRLNEIADIGDSGDTEALHDEADTLVRQALEMLGAEHIANAYERGRKHWWYA